MRSTSTPRAIGRAAIALVAIAACSPKPRSTTDTARTGATTAAAAPASAPATQTRPGDWIAYNGSLAGDRYSPLTQITTSNVRQLHQVCTFDAPDSVSMQSGIVAVNGTLYFTAFDNTYAIDGRTCQQKWKHTRAEPATYLNVNRGVGYGDGRLFRGTGDAHVVGIDAATGKQLWDVPVGDPKKGESTPMAPIAWNGMVFIGNAGGDNFGVTGRVYALDAATGSTKWRFDTVPDTGAAHASWGKASATNPPTGGAVWTSFALDSARGVLYVSTGNPAPDFVEAMHPGENLYTTSLLALDARTGRLLAYVQPIKNDYHDWDVSAAPALVTTKGGQALTLDAAKDGFVYGIDRSRVPTSAPSVPDSTALAVRYKAVITTRSNTTTPFTTTRLTHFCPGTQGGAEWNGPSYSQQTGALYVNAIDWCTSVKIQSPDTLHGAPGQAWSGMDDPKHPFGVLDPVSQWKGWITAVDAETGATRWKVQTPKPMVAGITATAGGVVFTGDLDGNALAYDAATGKELWRTPTGKAIGGGVISYDAGGKQYVAVAAGMNSPIWPVKGGTARIVVYGLP